MRILLIDRDSLTNQLIRARLEEEGHEVVEEASKNDALLMLEQENFDAVFYDPAPLTDAKQFAGKIRRAARNYPYLVLMSKEIEEEEALMSSANMSMSKPLDGVLLKEVVGNAERITRLIGRIGDDAEDFPSAGGIIAKSAFNQLFLSSFDRANRHGERSYYIFIGMTNYDEILNTDGPYAAEYSAAKISSFLARIRRQSDIVAQTGKSEYCLMLQRPQTPTEPIDAANRFGDMLGGIEEVCVAGGGPVQIHVSLIDVPVGKMHVQHIVDYTSQAANQSA